MTDEDKAVSFRTLRLRLFLDGWTGDVEADEKELHLALLRLLLSCVGADGMWAARRILNSP